jgi:hypothetical protein
MKAEQEREYREEAERLKQLPRAEQRAIVELIGSPARDPEVSEENRKEARRRASALSRLLKLTPRKKRK